MYEVIPVKKLLCLALCLFAGFAQAGGEKLYVYNWTEYLPNDLLKDFEKETGIDIIYSTYDSNETMYAKVSLQKAKGYDVILPSADYISKMGREGLLLKLDHSKLPGMAHIDPKLLDKPYDPGNQFSVPYLWGSTGIGINTAQLPAGSVKSWQDLWDPKYKNSLLLTDDVREIFHMALKIKGYSANTSDEAQIREAYELLKSLMPNVLAFNSDAAKVPFIAGDVNVGVIWNGEAEQGRAELKTLQYIYPAEGAVFWADSFAIPAGAANVENAYKFIEFMLRPENAVRCVAMVGYATPNKDALPLLDAALRDNKTIYPDQADLDRGEFHKDVGEATAIYEKYWQQLKAGR